MAPSINDNKREQHILNLSGGLLSEGSDLDEARVDAEFLFRFEVVWCKWVSRIRTMMRSLIGQSGDAPLSDKDGARWLVHLDINVGLQVGIQLGGPKTHYSIKTSRGGYYILDERLKEEYDTFVEHSLKTAPNGPATGDYNFDEIWQRMWLEANQTSKIQDELDRLCHAYNLIPKEYELGEYALNQVKQQYGVVRNWVVWGHYAPSFFHERTMLIENDAKDLIERSIRPWKWPKDQQFSKERLPLTIRIRTWAIYYLTQRGGGTLEQLSAIELWNVRFPGLKIDPAHYENNRTKLFALGTGKGFAPSLAASFTNVRKRWALLIGINEYDDTAFGPLHVCVNDVESIAQCLVSGGFGQDSTHRIVDSSDNLPTRLNILKTLIKIAKATEPDDLLLFYFSGHGIEENGESYLVPKDVNRIVMRDSAVSISRVKEIMLDAPARTKVIILDACHSGAKIGGKGDKRMSEAFVRHVFEEAEGIAILSSCKQGELSYELSTRDHSVFTHFLLEALKGESDREGKGFVTAQDVNLYVLDRVKKWTAQNEHIQTPTFQSTTVGDIPLTYYQQ